MRACDIQVGQATTIELKATEGSFGQVLPALAEILLQRSPATGEVLVRLADRVWEVEASREAERRKLAALLDRGQSKLAWIEATWPKLGPTDRILVQTREFAAEYLWPGPLDLGVDEAVIDQVRQLDKGSTALEVRAWLTEQMLIRSDGKDVRALMRGSPSAGPPVASGFRLLGHGYAVDIFRNEQDQLSVKGVVRLHRSATTSRRFPVFLVRGQWQFVDHTIAATFRGVARSELDEIVREGRGYLQLWHKYNEVERDFLRERSREFGWLDFDGSEQLPSGQWRFHLTTTDLDRTEKALRYLRDNQETDLEAATGPPAELQGKTSEPRADLSERGEGAPAFAGSLVALDRRRMTLDLQLPAELENMSPAQSGAIFVSISGDRVRLRRREEAYDALASAECPMPQLGLILEGRPVRQRRTKTIKPLSDAARNAFGGEPTQRQIEALQVALNTPDIALIQGPPGTGKTRVIAALQARLAQEAEGEDGAAGLVLLTSYQHDAVENAASATQAFGLPAIRVGGRRTAGDVDDPADRWRREHVAEMTADLNDFPDHPCSAALRRVRALATAYLEAPKPKEDAAKLLVEVEGVTAGLLPTPLVDRILELRQALSIHGSARGLDNTEIQAALTAVRGLRVEGATFADDGPVRAYKAFKRLELADLLDPKTRELLLLATEHIGPEPPVFLDDLRCLQAHLIDRLLPDARPAGRPTVNSDVEAVLGAAIDALYQRLRDSNPGVGDVLCEYRDDLEHDVEGVRFAIQRYTTALAATCQQSVSRHMVLIKGERVVFDTVVVDEAARANPLDLFIPMTLAQRRIILVGDHRQLPHVLEPKVERALKSTLAQETETAIRTSLFERLFTLMRQRERDDGIKRTVTLDTQYRMHPLLGQFVSDTFYAPYGEGLRSGRAAAEFAHELTGYREALVAWKEIPLRAGPESDGRSKYRQPEAAWIAQEAARICQERPDLSVGVISFYSAQVDAIQKAMIHHGLAEQTEDGNYRVAPSYRETRDRAGRLKERLRVGTVDAFQGKEFDVVLLSMTRSNDYPTDGETALLRKYGHLMLENRLCVAMSRQQRLLVVVGDSGMLGGEVPKQVVRGLVAFHAFSGGPNGIRI